jgi:anthranilate phosphoribosyltransferase
VSGAVDSLEEGITTACQAIDSGSTDELLNRLGTFSSTQEQVDV